MDGKKRLPLELEHINGISNDNRLENSFYFVQIVIHVYQRTEVK
jgi:hypothetical protein